MIKTDDDTQKKFGGSIAYKLIESTGNLEPCSLPGTHDRNEPIHPCRRYLTDLQDNDELLSKISLPEPLNTDQLEVFKDITTDENSRFWLGFFTTTYKDYCEKKLEHWTERPYYRMSNPDSDPIDWINDNWAPNEPSSCGEYYLLYDPTGVRDISTDNPDWASQVICVYVENNS